MCSVTGTTFILLRCVHGEQNKTMFIRIKVMNTFMTIQNFQFAFVASLHSVQLKPS